jgi:hypothetical protein
MCTVCLASTTRRTWTTVPSKVCNTRWARFHFKSGPLAQRGTFKGVWLNVERTEWALEKEQQ